MADNGLPEGYVPSGKTSPFLNHIGNFYSRRTTDANGGEIVSAALRIADHHVNTWNFAHAAVIAAMADIGTTGPAYTAGHAPVVCVDLSIQFIGAPKLGELLEVHGWVTKRTRSLVFSQCRGEVGSNLVFTATSVQKIIGA